MGDLSSWAKRLAPSVLHLVDTWLPSEVHLDGDAERRGRLIVGISFGLALLLSLGLVLRLLIAELTPAIIGITAAAVLVCTLVPVVVRTTGRLDPGGTLVTLTCLAMLFVLAYLAGGLHRPVLALLPILPLVATFLVGRRAGARMTVTVCLGVLAFALLHLEDWPFPAVPLDERQEMLARCLMICLAVSLVGLFAWIYERRRTESEERLRRARDEAEHANQVKSLFLANMSHEIRTPMSGILGVSELLARQEFSGEARDYVETIESSAEKLLRIIDDILDFSKIEAGKLSLETTAFHLADTVREAVDLLTPRARAKDLELSLHVEDNLPPWLRGDSSRLSQVLLNLIGNAIKFTVEGRIEVRVTRERAAHEHVEVRFAVSDTGIGIPEEALRDLFNPFTQADSSMARRFGGTGLGLAISHRLVEMMGGTLQVESQVERGSTFSFTAPFQPTVGPGKSSSTSLAVLRPRGRRCRILIAEDDPVNRFVAVRMLGGLGFEIDVAENGHEVLDAVGAKNYELVLMDCQMPELDGYETCRRLRRQEGHQGQGRHIPVVAVTAHAMKGDREKCLAAGMDDYVSKPFREKELRAMVDRWIPAREGGQEDSEEEASEPREDGFRTLDAGRIDILRGLHALGQVIEIFLEDAPALFEKIRRALDAGDLATVEQTAHRLKGSLANLGAPGLSKSFKELEFLATEGDPEPCRDKLEAVEAEYREVKQELEELLVREVNR